MRAHNGRDRAQTYTITYMWKHTTTSISKRTLVDILNIFLFVSFNRKYHLLTCEKKTYKWKKSLKIIFNKKKKSGFDALKFIWISFYIIFRWLDFSFSWVEYHKISHFPYHETFGNNLVENFGKIRLPVDR